MFSENQWQGAQISFETSRKAVKVTPFYSIFCGFMYVCLKTNFSLALYACKVPTFKVKLNKVHRTDPVAVTKASQI